MRLSAPQTIRTRVYSQFACILLSLLGASGASLAQEVTRVYPHYVVEGQTTNFTAEGRNLPTDTSANLGMKHTFDKPAECSNARRDRPATSTQYHFSCDFKRGALAGTARLQVFQRVVQPVGKKKKAGPVVSVKLWEDTLQVLQGKPHVDSVTLMGDPSSGQTLVDCPTPDACTTVVGDLHTRKTVRLDVTGKNLPYTLHLKFDGCALRATQPELANTGVNASFNTISRSFTCTLQTEGLQTIAILSASPSEGGVALHAAQALVLPVTGN